jgi:hypothetical protein
MMEGTNDKVQIYNLAYIVAVVRINPESLDSSCEHKPHKNLYQKSLPVNIIYFTLIISFGSPLSSPHAPLK